MLYYLYEKARSGFTIVELLIVIVVIGILAAITVVAYNGLQERARDSQRKSDIAAITKALELYYVDNNEYPSSVGGSTAINTSWSVTTDGSWAHLESQLVPKYMSSLPTDPSKSTSGNPQGSGNYGYAFFSNRSTINGYCGAVGRQMYILVYQLESSSNVQKTQGDCPSNALSYSAASYTRIVK